MDSFYRHGYDIDIDFRYRHGLMVSTWTHGINMDSWYWLTIGIDSDSWYIIDTPESHTYERAKCCPYAGFFCIAFNPVTKNSYSQCLFEHWLKHKVKKCLRISWEITLLGRSDTGSVKNVHGAKIAWPSFHLRSNGLIHRKASCTIKKLQMLISAIGSDWLSTHWSNFLLLYCFILLWQKSRKDQAMDDSLCNKKYF